MNKQEHKCEGCKRAKGSDTIYTCNCNVNKQEQEADELYLKYGKELSLRLVNDWLESVKKPIFGFIYQPKKVLHWQQVKENINNK